MAETQSGPLKRYWPEISLLAITLIGLALRFYRLDAQEAFSEEVFTVAMNSSTLYQILMNLIINPQSGQAPLFFLIDKISTVLFGEITLFSMRFPAAIFGILCIPAIYALGKEFRDETTGLLAALVIALSERMVFYSQYARPYTLIFLLFMAAAFCFLKVEKTDLSKKWMALFFLSSILCLWTHYYSVIPLALFWGILIFQNWKKILPYIAVMPISSGVFILYAYTLIVVLLTSPPWTTRPDLIFNVTWLDLAMRIPYECWGFMGAILIPLFLLHLLTGKDTDTMAFGFVAAGTYLITVASAFVFDPSARYAVLIAPLIIVPALVPVSWFIGSRKTAAQKIIIFAGMAYLILMANLFPLIAWYTTAFHFVFI